MLVDLGRNDVGRVCKYGTVKVDELMIIERYSHVMHIVSNVTGELQDGMTALDALMACLPAGTLSGAPKVRAMEIIDEIEPTKRGPYGGSVGYFDFSGNMDTCITIRTAVIQGDVAHVQAGGGIVADSVPEREFEETLNKAKALLRAIQLAQAMGGTAQRKRRPRAKTQRRKERKPAGRKGGQLQRRTATSRGGAKARRKATDRRRR
jgi:anthranilate synthase component 1